MPKHTFLFIARRGLIVTGLVLLSLVITAPTSYGQEGGNWSAPVLMGEGWFPDVAVDPSGRAHVVWSSTKDGDAAASVLESRGYDVIMYAAQLEGAEWTDAVDTIALPQGSGSEVTRPALLIDANGMAHQSFRGTSVFYSNVPIDSIAALDAWLSFRRISTDQVAYFSRLAFDSQDRLHLVFTQNVPTLECEVCYHVFYRRSDNGGSNWSNLTEISLLPTGAAKPQLVVDEQDNLHVVWEAGLGGAYGQLSGPTKVMYAASYDQGETWTYPVEFVAPGGGAKNITIGVGGDGKLMVAWLGVPEGLVYYQFSQDQGRTWSRPSPIPNIVGGSGIYDSRLDAYAMATDSAGHIHLVLVGQPAGSQNSLSVLHLTWDGTAWSAPEAITTLTGDVPEWPRIAIGNGNQLHVAWFVRNESHIWDSGGEGQDYKVWYARGSAASAPAVAPALPTATPTATPMPSPTATPTPTALPSPTPTLDPGIAQFSVPAGAIGSVRTEGDELWLLVKSVFPATLIIVTVLFGFRLLRR